MSRVKHCDDVSIVLFSYWSLTAGFKPETLSLICRPIWLAAGSCVKSLTRDQSVPLCDSIAICSFSSWEIVATGRGKVTCELDVDDSLFNCLFFTSVSLAHNCHSSLAGFFAAAPRTSKGRNLMSVRLARESQLVGLLVRCVLKILKCSCGRVAARIPPSLPPTPPPLLLSPQASSVYLRCQLSPESLSALSVTGVQPPQTQPRFN